MELHQVLGRQRWPSYWSLRPHGNPINRGMHSLRIQSVHMASVVIRSSCFVCEQKDIKKALEEAWNSSGVAYYLKAPGKITVWCICKITEKRITVWCICKRHLIKSQRLILYMYIAVLCIFLFSFIDYLSIEKKKKNSYLWETRLLFSFVFPNKYSY